MRKTAARMILVITSIILAVIILITVVFDEYQNVYSATYSLTCVCEKVLNDSKEVAITLYIPE